jgi:hypothetical protein
MSLDAHVHGAISLDIAVDKGEVLIMVKSPAASFLGFEYKAKTKAEKEKVKKVKDFFTKTPQKIFEGDSLKSCSVTSSDWKQSFHGKSHSSVYSEIYLKCGEKISGAKVKLALFKVFPLIESIQIQVMSEKMNISKKIHNNKFVISL